MTITTFDLIDTRGFLITNDQVNLGENWPALDDYICLQILCQKFKLSFFAIGTYKLLNKFSSVPNRKCLLDPKCEATLLGEQSDSCRPP